MKKIFAILFLACAVAFVSCENGISNGDNQWFKQPLATVSGTSVYVECLSTFGEGVLASTPSGFVYMNVSGSGAEVTVTTPDVDGNTLSCRLSGLLPKTTYIIYAFVDLGTERLQSRPTLFETGEDGENPDPDPDPDPEVKVPAFGTPSSSGVTASSASVSCSFTYEGTETITKVSFIRVAPDNAEQAVAVENVAAGEKTVQFTNLAASTTYNFFLRVEIGGKSYASTRASFTTLPGSVTPPPVGDTKYPGWPELPIEVKNSDYHYAYHICPDFKVAGRLARNFTVCYSAENHCPVWVSAPRHACYEVKNADRTDAYGKDPAIMSSIQYSSKSTGGGCNKGHMLGSAERLVTRETNKQVFYYTNIAPQLSGTFNTGGGAWNNLEGFVDAQVCADTTYIVVGTYFKPFTDAYGQSCSPTTISFGGRNDVTRPSMFYYLILRTKSGSTRKAIADCAPSELKCAAFVLRHNMEKGHKPQAKDLMKVSDIEKMTGFTFFANVPNAPKDTFSASDWGL